MSNETVRQFATYGQAAQAACQWVQPPPVQANMEFYNGTVGPNTGRRLGVGIRRTALVDIVRIDVDDTGKGIHFNARRDPASNQNKLAAVITPTVAMTPGRRQALFQGYLTTIARVRTVQELWDIWLRGSMPQLFQQAEGVEGEADEVDPEVFIKAMEGLDALDKIDEVKDLVEQLEQEAKGKPE